MSDEQRPGDAATPGGEPPTFTQDLPFSSVGARVPDKVARGVFCTGIVVIQSASEFVLDFMQRMNRPHQVVARVVVPVGFVPQLVNALRENLDKQRKTFGPPTSHETAEAGKPAAEKSPPPTGAAQPAAGGGSPPPAAPPQQPSIEELYSQLKLPDEALGGVYANTAMLTHTAGEFCIDFIASFYPRPVVTARVFLSAAQMPAVLSSLTQAWQKHQARGGH